MAQTPQTLTVKLDLSDTGSQIAQYIRQEIKNRVAAIDPQGVAGTVADAIDRVRTLHRQEYGCCAECTHESGVVWPCATIRAIDGPTEH
ncbi:MAG: hypothetical protein JWO98_149 [Frankiales bacterium]|nr:hypothetical protein [Frankiales bacterium]